MSTDATATGSSLSVEALTKTFGSATVVDDVSFVLEPGQLLTLLGPSGSGKTTTMRMIAGFEEPTAGRIRIDGQDITAQAAHRRNIGVVFQQYALFPHLTVFENVAYPLRMRRVPRRQLERQVNEALDMVRLSNMESRLPRQLSGGQQQRVALARAVVFRPPVLLMDEPMGALDKRLREIMQVEIRQLQKTLGITTVSVTHDQVEALVMSDLVAVMDGGRLQQIGRPAQLYRRPANRFVADFIGESNILDGAVGATPSGVWQFRSRGGLVCDCQPPAAVQGDGQPCTVVVRPESIRIVASGESGPAGPAVTCRIVDRLYVGDLIRLRLRNAGGEELIAKMLATREVERLDVGQAVQAWWDAQDCLVLAD
jgi:spermidine/putrescine ABC transporter ATP-binding subunit